MRIYKWGTEQNSMDFSAYIYIFEITYKRGHMTIVGRKLMEDRVSEAYLGLKKEYYRLLSNKPETETENRCEAKPIAFGSIRMRRPSMKTEVDNGQNLWGA
ncbi:hypothetical protein C8R32_1185 [Nitrosospira sp. Nsp5]|nr:hypothetical protein C8R32_1185 [Nitrosospira sp. Nsp5]